MVHALSKNVIDINPLGAKLLTKCLSAFDHFVGLALKGEAFFCLLLDCTSFNFRSLTQEQPISSGVYSEAIQRSLEILRQG